MQAITLQDRQTNIIKCSFQLTTSPYFTNVWHKIWASSWCQQHSWNEFCMHFKYLTHRRSQTRTCLEFGEDGVLYLFQDSPSFNVRLISTHITGGNQFGNSQNPCRAILDRFQIQLNINCWYIISLEYSSPRLFLHILNAKFFKIVQLNSTHIS